MSITTTELALLDESQRNSDALVSREERAMDAVKQGDATSLARARELMHDQTYHVEKTRIMDPIDDFFGMIDYRTQASVLADKERNASLLLTIRLYDGWLSDEPHHG